MIFRLFSPNLLKPPRLQAAKVSHRILRRVIRSIACDSRMPAYPSRRLQPLAGFRSARSDAGKRITEHRLRCSSSCICSPVASIQLILSSQGFGLAKAESLTINSPREFWPVICVPQITCSKSVTFCVPRLAS